MGAVATLHPRGAAPPVGRLDLHDLDTLRLVLRGHSVVDWRQLHFTRAEDVDAFLRVNELRPTRRPEDRERMEDLRARSVEYLRSHLGYRRIPDEVSLVDDPTELFFLASSARRRRIRMFSCMCLKVMHILHYQEGHELLARLPLSGAEVSVLLQAKVERVIRGMLESKTPLVTFAGNTKTNDSILSKLLAKQDSQVAKVFDKLRFRIVTERIEDIPPLICTLTRELMPFNYLVPGQSDNTLFDLDKLLVRAGNMTAVRSPPDRMNEPPESAKDQTPKNEFSGPSYRIVSFVCEVPVRIDHAVPLEGPALERLGHVVFGTVEFQLVDRVSAERNESGENRHALYKFRQRTRVKERLERGRAAPRRWPRSGAELSGAPGR